MKLCNLHVQSRYATQNDGIMRKIYRTFDWGGGQYMYILTHQENQNGYS